MARAIRIHETGGPEVMRLEDVEVGPPGEGEVQVRHTAIGLNFIDVYDRSGLYPQKTMPAGLGREAAGVRADDRPLDGLCDAAAGAQPHPIRATAAAGAHLEALHP